MSIKTILEYFKSFQRDFNNNNLNCYLDEIRIQNLKSISKIIPVEPLEDIQLSVEDIGRKINQNLQDWVKNVKDHNNNFSLSLDTCKTIFNQIFNQIEDLVDDRGKKAEYLTKFLDKIRGLIPDHEYSEETTDFQIQQIYYDVLGAK
ncbi:MAG: hypothetical protein EAX96_06115 [Candidatus Lokiarchaeota archaeon]|nr:hypothetical protein [Candidatus Lokiarchaeota archaeon]